MIKIKYLKVGEGFTDGNEDYVRVGMRVTITHSAIFLSSRKFIPVLSFRTFNVTMYSPDIKVIRHRNRKIYIDKRKDK